MPKLKPIYIYLALGIIILVAGILLKTRSSPSNPSKFPEPSPPPLPSGILNQNSNLQIRGDLSSLPEINSVVQFSLSPIEPDLVANSLSYLFQTENPKRTDYPNGQFKYTWIINSAELNYYPDKSYLNYFNPSVLNSQQALPSSLADQSISFIQAHLSLSSQIKLSLVNTTYLQSNESVAKAVSSPAQANLIQYEYRYLLDGKPLYFGELGTPDIIITLNSDGVRNFKSKIPPQIIPTNNQQQVINSSQVKQQLLDNQYTIIKVDNHQYYGSGPLFNVATMTIDSTSLGYIVNFDQIYPVYIIRGEAANVESPKITYSLEIAINALNL